MNDAALLKNEQLGSGAASETQDRSGLAGIEGTFSRALQISKAVASPVVLSLIVSFSLCHLWRVVAIRLLGIQPGSMDGICLLYTGLIGTAALAVAGRTTGIARIGALAQLSVLSLVMLVVLGARETAAPFIDVLLAVASGTTAGVLLQRFLKQQRLLETQEYELRLRRKQLKEAKLVLVKNDEVERRLLAADLHDQVLHDLKIVRQRLTSCREQVGSAEFDALQEDLAHAMSAVREVMDQLFPSSLEHLGLVGAIEECLDKAAERCGFESFVRAKISESELNASISKVETLLLFRLIQESVNNIVKHAQPKSVSCHIFKEKEELIFRITDDGKGFESGSDEGRGLRYMKQRAELIGANIAWFSNGEGCGTVVEIRLNKSLRETTKTQVTS